MPQAAPSPTIHAARLEMDGIAAQAIIDAQREIDACSVELRQIVDDLNETAGYQRATIHRGELMKPAKVRAAAPRKVVSTGLLNWPEAKDYAVKAAFAECRASEDPIRRVHLGDWFERTAVVRTKPLPGGNVGMSSKMSPALKRLVTSRTIHDARVPLPRFWPEPWQSAITKAVNESGGP